MGDQSDDDVVFEGQTATPVLESKRHFLAILSNEPWKQSSWWKGTSMHQTLRQLFFPHPFDKPVKDSSQQSTESRSQLRQHLPPTASKRIDFLESSKCPLAVYMMEYELASCLLIYMLLCGIHRGNEEADKSGRQAFQRRIPISRRLRRKMPNGSCTARSSGEGIPMTKKKKSPFITAMEQFIRKPESKKRVMELWDPSKLGSELKGEKIALYDPYITRSLIWCLRLNKFQTRLRMRGQKVGDSTMKKDKNDKNELNADVLNAWMRLLQREDTRKTKG